MRKRNHRERGNTLIEFTLVGIGLIFLLISIAEMARGMWVFHTLAHVSKEATRFAIVHGRNCELLAGCASYSTKDELAKRMRFHGVGLLPNDLEVTVETSGGTNYTGSLNSMLGDTALWAPYPANQVGLDVMVTVRYPFRSALAMLWPGGGRVGPFGVFNLGARSREVIQF
jgi:hypothetical protein